MFENKYVNLKKKYESKREEKIMQKMENILNSPLKEKGNLINGSFDDMLLKERIAFKALYWRLEELVNFFEGVEIVRPPKDLQEYFDKIGKLSAVDSEGINLYEMKFFLEKKFLNPQRRPGQRKVADQILRKLFKY